MTFQTDNTLITNREMMTELIAVGLRKLLTLATAPVRLVFRSRRKR